MFFYFYLYYYLFLFVFFYFYLFICFRRVFAEKQYVTEAGEPIPVNQEELLEEIKKGNMYKEDHVYTFNPPR